MNVLRRWGSYAVEALAGVALVVLLLVALVLALRPIDFVYQGF